MGISKVTANCVVYSMQTSSYETIPGIAVAGIQSTVSPLFPTWCKFSRELQEDSFTEKCIYCSEATFHISGKVNHQNV